MGNGRTWLIFLIGILAVSACGVALLVAVVAGIVFLARRSSGKASDAASKPPQVKPAPEQLSAGHSAYNVVSDMVAGVNVRKRDNCFQAIFILFTVLLASVAGAIAAHLHGEWHLPWVGGAIVGAIAGLVIGVIASGVLIMVFRAIKHSQGHHE